MQNTFEKNLSFLETQNPLLALQLRLKKSFTEISFQPNTHFDRNKLEQLDVIYVYGLEGYRELKDWLRAKENHRLILMEDDINRFGFFLSQIETEAVLIDPQVKVISLTHTIEENLKAIIWPYLFYPSDFFVVGASDERRKKKAEYISSLFHELKMGAEMATCLYRNYGTSHIKNILFNLQSSKGLIHGESLKNCFKGIPAVICGAGPSLEANIETLKNLEDRVLIFAGGSALGSLSQSNVSIHFGAAIDPNPPSERFLRQNYFELPFFYQNQVASDIFSKLQAERICFGESGGFPLEKWILTELGIEMPSFDAGFTVTTFLVHIAEKLGCSPIIFVGVDSCLEKSKVYAEGAKEYDEKEERENPIITQDRFGHPVLTRKDFLMTRSWIEEFGREHPKLEILNANMQGLHFKGIREMPLDQISLTSIYDLRAKIHQVLESAKRETLDPLKIAQILSKIKASCELCLELSEKILFSQKLYFQEEIELEETLFYQMVILPLWSVWRHFLQTEEVISRMQSPDFEKKIQRMLFIKEVCLNYKKEVFL